MVKDKLVIGLGLVCGAFIGGILAQRFLHVTDVVVKALEDHRCCSEELDEDDFELFDVIGKEETKKLS